MRFKFKDSKCISQWEGWNESARQQRRGGGLRCVELNRTYSNLLTKANRDV